MRRRQRHQDGGGQVAAVAYRTALPAAAWALAVAAALACACGDHGDSSQPAATAKQQPSCTDYCRLAQLRCAPSFGLFSDAKACLAACAQVPALGSIGQTSGDTVGCRISYLMLAERAPLHYCLLAGTDGRGPCHDPVTPDA